MCPDFRVHGIDRYRSNLYEEVTASWLRHGQVRIDQCRQTARSRMLGQRDRLHPRRQRLDRVSRLRSPLICIWPLAP